jgi:hypothetical protein
VAVGSHDEKVGAERGRSREQDVADALATRGVGADFDSDMVSREVARDVGAGLLPMECRALVRVHHEQLDQLGPRQERHRIRHGASCLATGVPAHEDAAARPETGIGGQQKHRPAGRQNERLREVRERLCAGHLATRDEHEIGMACLSDDLLCGLVSEDTPLRLEPALRRRPLEQGALPLFQAGGLGLVFLEQRPDG